MGIGGWKSTNSKQFNCRLLIEEQCLKFSEDAVVLTSKYVNKFSLKYFSCGKVGHKKNQCKNYSSSIKNKNIVCHSVIRRAIYLKTVGFVKRNYQRQINKM